MKCVVKNPKLKEFFSDRVRAGQFDSVDAAVEEALERLMFDLTAVEFSSVHKVAIEKGMKQIARGETIDFDRFAKRMKKKYSIR